MNFNFDEAKSLFWFNWINSTIPQDLQNLYQDDINKMKSAFLAGVDFSNQYWQSKNSIKGPKNDKSRLG